MKGPPPFDPYRVLGVTPAASDAELAAARKALSARHHPDRDRTPGAAARFVEVQQAHALLADPARRRAYDEHVERQRRAREAGAERARQEQAAAAERERRARQERAQADQDWEERARRAAAQREQAHRAQAEREAQLRRILERARVGPDPEASGNTYELRDPPAARPGDHRADDVGTPRGADDPVPEPLSPREAVLSAAAADAEVARGAAFGTAVGLAALVAAVAGLRIVGRAAVAAGTGFLVDGSFWLALLGAALAVPALFAAAFVVLLGLTYPMARPAAALASLAIARRGPRAAPGLVRAHRRAARRRWIYAACVGGCLATAGLILRWSSGLEDRPLAERELLMPLAPLLLIGDLACFYVATVWRALASRHDRETLGRRRPGRATTSADPDDTPSPGRRARGSASTLGPSPAAYAASPR